MTGGGNEPPVAERGETPVLSWRGRLEAFQRSVMRLSPMVGIMDVMRAYDRSGGGMLAGALAYFGFFTMVPALMLFVGLLGILVEDSQLREDLISGLVDQIDPISDLASFLVTELSDTGRLGTVIGVLGLLWAWLGYLVFRRGDLP